MGALPLTAAISCAGNMGYGIEWETVPRFERIQSDPATAALSPEVGISRIKLSSISCSSRE